MDEITQTLAALALNIARSEKRINELENEVMELRGANGLLAAQVQTQQAEPPMAAAHANGNGGPDA